MSFRELGILSLSLILSGCFSGSSIKKESLSQVHTLAIGGVIIDQIAPGSAHNNQILQATMDRAHQRLASGLAGFGSWKLVDISRSRQFSELKNLGIVSSQEINAMFASQFERNIAQAIIKRRENSYNAKYLAASGYPTLPKWAIAPKDTRDQEAQNMAAIYKKKIVSTIHKLGVDALVFLNVRASSGHEGSIYVINNDRTNGNIKMAQTFVIINKQGDVVIDMGNPPLDGLAASKSGLPMYVGKGARNVNFNNINLYDPKSETRKALNELVDETMDDLFKDFSKMLKS